MLHMATVAKRRSQWRPVQPRLLVYPDALFINDDGDNQTDRIHQTRFTVVAAHSRSEKNGSKISIYITFDISDVIFNIRVQLNSDIWRFLDKFQ